MTLADVKCGSSAIVTDVKAAGKMRRKLLDMGLTKGAAIEVRKVAPLGDPIELSIRGYSLSIRKEDAALIEVEPVA